MLNKRERLLLNVLFWLVMGCLLIIFIFIRSAHINQARSEIIQSEENIKNLELALPDQEKLVQYHLQLQKEIEAEEVKFFKKEEVDFTQLGKKIQQLLIDNNLILIRLQKVELGENPFIEISFKGKAVDFMQFLTDIYNMPQYWNVSYLTISKKGNSYLDAAMRISYETLEKVSD